MKKRFSRVFPYQWIGILFLCVFCLLIQTVSSHAIEEEYAIRQILVIQSNHEGIEGSQQLTESIRRALDAYYTQGEGYQLFVEYVDALRLRDRESRSLLADYIKTRYGSYGVDGVMLVGEESVVFAQTYLTDLIETHPTIHLDLDMAQRDQVTNAHIQGRFMHVPFENMTSIAKTLNPELSTIHILVKSSINIQKYEAELQALSQAYDVEFHTHWTVHDEEMLIFSKDPQADEMLFVINNMTESLASHSIQEWVGQRQENGAPQLPILSNTRALLDRGILGSISQPESNYIKGNIYQLIRLIEGDHVKEGLMNQDFTSPQLTFDYYRMGILGMDPDLLPEETEFINRPSISRWIGEHALETILFALVLSLLIVLFAFFNVLLRFKAEKDRENTQKDLELSYMELEAAHAQLIASEGELSRQFNELQLKEDELRRSRERYRLAATGSEFGIWDYDVHANSLYLSRKAKEILGLDPEGTEYHLEAIYERFDDQQIEGLKEEVLKHIKQESRVVEYSLNYMDQEQQRCWISFRGKGQFEGDGSIARMAGSLIDVTKEQLSKEYIQNIAYSDDLTGLQNRAYYNERIANLQSRHKPVAILLLDLDNFKTINDSMGHDFGDRILSYVAHVLTQEVGHICDLVRLGGDEFVLLFESDSSKSKVDQVSQVIYQAFKDNILIDGIAVSTTLSMGAAFCPGDTKQADQLLKHADMALYHAKENGKNQLAFFTPSMEDKVIQRVWYERELKAAIEQEQFELYYQPQYHAALEVIDGFEALIRWHHPERGLISPAEFIPMAEEMGMIIPIGRWVMEEAIQQVAKWNDAGLDELTVSINLSPIQFKDSKLVSLLEQLVKAYGVAPQQIELEITETAALKDVDHAIYLLSILREKGYRIALDDFGTGYSSLNYLSVLPIDTLKMDKTFIADGMTIQSNESLIKTVIELAHAYSMNVVAEGVETLEQLNFLKSEKCDRIQGYYISRPLPVHAIDPKDLEGSLLRAEV